jgi:tellurite resistance protein
MAFGLSGLAGSWVTAAGEGHAPAAVGRVLLAFAAAVWLVTLAFYVRHALAVPGTLRAHLADTTVGPFSSLAVITPMLLGSLGIAPYSITAARIVVDVFLVLTVLLGGWLTGQWIYGPLEVDRLHPGYFLPTVAGGLVAATSAALVGRHRVAEVVLGLGMICWALIGSVIMVRLFFRPLPPPALLPTLAIEVAPPAVGGLAWFAVNGDRVDLFASVLAGYGLLMVVAQLRLLPAYLRLHFTPGTWSFTFSWAAVASLTLHWIEWGKPAGHLVWTYLVLAAVTVLIGGIAVRTALALARRQLLPPPPAAPLTPGPR